MVRWQSYCLTLVCAFFASSPSLAVYDFDYIDEVWIYSEFERGDGCPAGDGIEISSNVFIPNGGPSDLFPAIILVPGWGNTKYEYIKQAEYLATKGYVVFSYSPRGMGESEGAIEIVSENDVSDFCSAIDWLLENTPTDPNNIGAYGMSYGGGVSLIGLAHDERVKAVATASTWGDIKNSLFEANTPNQVWIGNLLFGGEFLGTVDPEIYDIKDALFSGENLEYPTQWAALRSPLNYLDVYNQRTTLDLVTGKQVSGAPIYISKNNGDYLFKSNRLIEMYERLQGPKKMDTNLGTHSQQEQVGMDLRPNVTWDNVHLWFDYWLRGIDNNVLDNPPMSMRVKNLRYRDYFSSWPSERVEEQILYLNKDEWGGYLSEFMMFDNDVFPFTAAVESGVTIGAPVLTPWLETFGLIHRIDLEKVDPTASANFMGNPLEETLKIRGVVEMDAWLSVEKTRTLTVAYLFDVSPSGQARLITHGPVSLLDAVPGEPINVNFEMAAVAYDVEPGHQLALFFDGGEWLYYSAEQDPYQIELLVGADYPSSMSMLVRTSDEPVSEENESSGSDVGNEISRGANGSGADGKTSEGGSLGLTWMFLLMLFLGRNYFNKIFQRQGPLV